MKNIRWKIYMGADDMKDALHDNYFGDLYERFATRDLLYTSFLSDIGSCVFVKLPTFTYALSVPKNIRQTTKAKIFNIHSIAKTLMFRFSPKLTLKYPNPPFFSSYFNLRLRSPIIQHIKINSK